MTKDQKHLLKVLHVMETASMVVEEAENIIVKLSDEQLHEVIKEHKDKYGKCDLEDMRKESFDFEGAVNTATSVLEARLR